MKIDDSEDSTCINIPFFAFVKKYLVDYKTKLYIAFSNKVLYHSIYLKDSLNNNNIIDVIKPFSFQEYKKTIYYY